MNPSRLISLCRLPHPVDRFCRWLAVARYCPDRNLLKIPVHRPARSLLASMAALTVTCAGVGLAPAANAEDALIAPSLEPRNFMASGYADNLGAQVNRSPGSTVEDYALAARVGGIVSQQFYSGIPGRIAYSEAHGAYTSFDLPQASRASASHSTWATAAPQTATGAPGASTDNQITVGASTATTHTSMPNDGNCAPIGESLYTSTATVTDFNLGPVTLPDGSTLDLGGVTGQVSATSESHMFALPGGTTRRGVETTSQGSTGTYHLFDNRVTVEVVTPVRASVSVDGVSPGQAEVLPATMRITDPKGIVTEDPEVGTILTFDDPLHPNVRMELRLLYNSEYVSDDATTSRASGGAAQAWYYYYSPEFGLQTIGHVLLGGATVSAQVPVGGVECSTVPDTDDDGLNDYVESQLRTDPANADTDADGLTDGAEVNLHKTNPLVADTDKGSVNDGVEVARGTDPLKAGDDVQVVVAPIPVDTDDDGLTDAQETTLGTDPAKADTDNDGLTDGAEVNLHKTDPLVADTNKGSVNDGSEIANGTDPLDGTDDIPVVVPDPVTPALPAKDTDKDGLTDAREKALGTNPAKADTDNDGLRDKAEVTGSRNPKYGNRATNPLKADTDRDGLKDGREVRRIGSNPNRADTDRDGLKDGVEVEGFHNTRFDKTFKSNPLKADSDNDGLRDKAEVTGSRNAKFKNEPTNPRKKDTDRGGVNDLNEIKAGSNPANIKSGPRNP